MESVQTQDKLERYTALPYRVADAFADGELDSLHIIILWWVVSHVTPPRWKYSRQLRALATDLRWEEIGKSQKTLARKIDDLHELGWIVVQKPAERSRKPWAFRLRGAEVHKSSYNDSLQVLATVIDREPLHEPTSSPNGTRD